MEENDDGRVQDHLISGLCEYGTSMLRTLLQSDVRSGYMQSLPTTHRVQHLLEGQLSVTCRVFLGRRVPSLRPLHSVAGSEHCSKDWPRTRSSECGSRLFVLNTMETINMILASKFLRQIKVAYDTSLKARLHGLAKAGNVAYMRDVGYS